MLHTYTRTRTHYVLRFCTPFAATLLYDCNTFAISSSFSGEGAATKCIPIAAGFVMLHTPYVTGSFSFVFIIPLELNEFLKEA